MFISNIGVKTVKWETMNKHLVTEKKVVHYILSALSLKFSTPTAHIFGYLAIPYGF